MKAAAGGQNGEARHRRQSGPDNVEEIRALAPPAAGKGGPDDGEHRADQEHGELPLEQREPSQLLKRRKHGKSGFFDIGDILNEVGQGEISELPRLGHRQHPKDTRRRHGHDQPAGAPTPLRPGRARGEQGEHDSSTRQGGGEGHALQLGPRQQADHETRRQPAGRGLRLARGRRGAMLPEQPGRQREEEQGGMLRGVVDEIRVGGRGKKGHPGQHGHPGERRAVGCAQQAVARQQRPPHQQQTRQAGIEKILGHAQQVRRQQGVEVKRTRGGAVDRVPEDRIVLQRDGAGDELALVRIQLVGVEQIRPAPGQQQSEQKQGEPDPFRPARPGLGRTPQAEGKPGCPNDRRHGGDGPVAVGVSVKPVEQGLQHGGGSVNRWR